MYLGMNLVCPKRVFFAYKMCNLFHQYLQDGFIGFGGNQVRERVKTGSAWFVMDFRELLDELNNSRS